MGPEVLVPIGFFAMITICVVGVSMARAIARHADYRRVDSSPDVTARLERMEQAIDAIAIEVERVSEAQRFTTRLLSEKAARRTAPNDSGDRDTWHR